MWIFPNNSIFIKSSFTLKLDFLKIEFQNRGILLYFLDKMNKCLFWSKDFVHTTGLYNNIIIIIMTLWLQLGFYKPL